MICEGRQGRVAGQRVRRAALADDTGRYKVLDHPKEWRSGTISRADVADFLLKQVQDSSYLGKTPVLTN